MVDPRAAHVIDARTFLSLVPRLDQTDLHEFRRQFALYLSSRQSMTRHATWQEAWNDWTGATPGRSGQVRFTPLRCKQCHGKRFDVRHVSRNLARTGRPDICGECRGTGRGTPMNLAATYIAPPADPADEPAPDSGDPA